MTVKVVLCEAFNAIGAVTPFSLNPVPLTEACEMLTVDALLLVSVTISLLTPRSTLPKLWLVGLRASDHSPRRSRKRQCGRDVRRIAADRNRGAESSRSVGNKRRADRGVLANRDRDRKTWSTQGEILVGDRDAADRNGSRSGIRDGCGKCFARACRDTAKLQAGAAQNQSARLLLLIRRLSGTKSLATNQGYKGNKNSPRFPALRKIAA